MSSTRISELAAIISSNTAIVDTYLKTNHIPSPSFDKDAPIQNLGIPKEAIEIDDARRNALAASQELQDLLQGPTACLLPTMNASSLNAIYTYNIAAKVPLEEPISFADLAKQCNLPELDLRRILRFAMCWHRVFCEPKKNFVAHTAASRVLKENPNIYDRMGFMFEEGWQSMAKTVEAMQKFKSSEPNETGHALAHNTTDSMFAWFGKNPDKAKRFASAMSTFNPEGRQSNFLPNAFDWDSLNKSKGRVVDVGGSSGNISISLAELFKDLNFVVQDLPGAIAGAQDKVSAELKPRINFMAHDFFTEQPVVGDIYFFRSIFHSWPDPYCIRILRNMISALKNGAKILVCDSIVAEPGTLDLLAERNVRAYDMLMMTLFNARERELDDWIELFAEADTRFKFIEAKRPDVGTMSLLIFSWEE